MRTQQIIGTREQSSDAAGLSCLSLKVKLAIPGIASAVQLLNFRPGE